MGKEDTKDKTPAIRVVFTSNKNVRPPSDDEIITVYPVDPGWNDFGIHSRFDFTFYSTQSDPFIGEAKLAFLDDTDPHALVGVKLKKQPVIEARDLPKFFCLLAELDEYRKIVANLGPTNATRVLQALNEISLAAASPKAEPWVKQAIESKVFNHSIARMPQTYFAYLNGYHIIQGRDRASTLSPPEELEVNFKLASFPNAHELHFDFRGGGITSSRVCAMIGENGLGKSYALRRITESFLGGLSDEHVTGKDKSRAGFSHLLAVATPGETDRTFPPTSSRSRARYFRLTTGRKQNARRPTGTTALIMQLLRLEEEIGGIKRKDLFLESISPCLAPSQIGFRTRLSSTSIDASDFIPFESLLNAGEQSFLDNFTEVDQTKDPVFIVRGQAFPLSSGQIAFLSLAAQMSLHINSGSLVLLDEPETHLHPSLVAMLVRILERLLELVNGRAIVATHSPFLVRELPRSQVLVFRRDEDRRINISRPAMRTIGADVGTISFFVFGDQTFGQLLEKAKDDLKDLSVKEQREYIAKLEKEYSPEALMHLRAQLPDWNTNA